MDKVQCVDPQEEVRKLQEKVRELELQLSQQSSSVSRNGTNHFSSASKYSQEDQEEHLVPVNDVDISSKTWLMWSSNVSEDCPDEELIAGLRRDVAPSARKALYSAINQAEQDRRKNIDSRTFTRPKKRMGRPSLELLESLSCMSKPTDSEFPWALDSNVTELDNMTCSLLEASFTNSLYCSDTPVASDISQQLSIVNKKQKVATMLERRKGSLVLSDKSVLNSDLNGALQINEDTFSLKYDNGNSLSNHIENDNLPDFELLNQRENELETEDMHHLGSSNLSSCSANSTLSDSDPNCTIILKPKSKLSNSKVHELNTTFTPSPLSSDSSFKKVFNADGLNQHGNEILNQTFVKDDDESPINSSRLNNTFSLGSSGGKKSSLCVVRPRSTDSGGADDDILSSASDSSHTSASRMMSVGDVQHIARLQEQSLVISTPTHHNVAKVITYDEDNLSPIQYQPSTECGRYGVNSEHLTTGYGSDHSSRSPLSSLHSSPAGSPFGSSTALPGSNPNHPQDTRPSFRPNGVLQRKSTFNTVPSGLTKVGGIRAPAPVSSMATASRPTARSGLRPPAVRSKVPLLGSSGLPRASTGIPRPASLSRIPPPKVRTSASQPSRKEWTDECY